MLSFKAKILSCARALLCISLLMPGYAHAAEYRLVTFGDSLMAGYGLSAGKGFAPQLQSALTEAGLEVEVINMSVSGNTAADAAIRVRQVVKSKPHGVIVGFGGNDVLRHINPDATRANLARIITQLKQAGIDVLLAGMQSPLNWGPKYKAHFDQIFQALADDNDVILYPFFLEGVATESSLNLPDGIHPNEAGISVMVKNILPTVAKLIAQRS